jgi:hypothetical protein
MSEVLTMRWALLTCVACIKDLDQLETIISAIVAFNSRLAPDEFRTWRAVELLRQDLNDHGIVVHHLAPVGDMVERLRDWVRYDEEGDDSTDDGADSGVDWNDPSEDS